MTGNDARGTVTFSSHRAGGKMSLMSQHQDALKVGDTVDMRGPKGHLTYFKNGNFTVHPLPKRNLDHKRTAKRFGVISGGTAIAPILQAQTPSFATSLTPMSQSLLYANQFEDDIHIRQELEEAVEKNNGRPKFLRTISSPYDVGHRDAKSRSSESVQLLETYLLQSHRL